MPGEASAQPARAVLIVEEHAHWPQGHYPVLCTQLAAGYSELGYHVELLTAQGLARADDHVDPPFTLREYRPAARRVHRALQRHPRRTRWLRCALLLHEAEQAARSMSAAPEMILVLAADLDPRALALVAGRRRWLLYLFQRPDQVGIHRLLRPVRIALAKRAAQRRHRGGSLRAAAAHSTMADAWNAVAPTLDCTVLPIAGTRDLPSDPDGRAQLGLAAGARIALLFGAISTREPQPVVDAFADLDDWTLVVGGPAAHGVEPDEYRVTFPGVVSDDVRDRLIAAADLVVLAYPPRYLLDSGGLMEAISAGVPVACPADAAVAEIVQRHHLGVIYPDHDPESIRVAVGQAPTAVAPHDLARARHEYSYRALARAHLALFGLDPPAAVREPVG